MSAAYGQRYDYENQQSYLDRAIAIRRLLSDKTLLTEALALKANNALRSGHLSDAEKILNEAERIVGDGPEFIESRSQIRYARSITAEDLKGSNVILLGSIHTNPWVSLFDANLNFKLKYMPEVDQSFLWNEHPHGTEQKKYLNGTAGMVNRTYGAIDYLPNLDGTGHVLILQGLNMAATQAAADILSNPEEMEPVLKEAGLPNGSLKPFELIIETSSIGATDPSARIIATRFYPL